MNVMTFLIVIGERVDDRAQMKCVGLRGWNTGPLIAKVFRLSNERFVSAIKNNDESGMGNNVADCICISSSKLAVEMTTPEKLIREETAREADAPNR
jgi:hypothetical protein